MRKLTLHPLTGVLAFVYTKVNSTFLLSLLLSICTWQLSAQCIPLDNTISGTVFQDLDMNGLYDPDDILMGNVLVNVYDQEDLLVGSVISDAQGAYTVSGITNEDQYKVVFSYAGDYHSSLASADNGTSIQFVTAPSCNVSLGLANASQQCESNPELLLSCFVVGPNGVNDEVETIIGLEHNFGTSSSVVKYASKKETGSVWGVAWSAAANAAYSAAFVKQYAALTSHGHGAIFKTTIDDNNQGTTTLHVDLASRGLDLGDMAITDVTSCDYGSQVGRVGIGPLAIDDLESYLYTVNLHGKTLVKISTSAVNPTVQSIAIPNPGCEGGESAPFALKWYNDKLYVGVTCTAEYSRSANDSKIFVYEFDPAAESFTEIFSTDYIKGYWYDSPTNSINTMHWLTDIDFSDNGLMLLSLTDRIGHTYCNTASGRVDIQNPDLLAAYNENGVWKLESNATAGIYTGTGANNGQGPDGGEFFGDDFWISNPSYHPEIALGSIFALPGSGEVVASVYDPLTDSYSGGLHRYNTTSGRKVDAIQLYTHVIDVQFGKATGFGDITSRCGSAVTEIGNYVWHDANNNGVQDANEAFIEGLNIHLVDANCMVVGSTTTNASGQYFFNNSNVDTNGDGVFDGIEINTPYFISIASDQYDIANGTVALGADNYTLCDASSNTDGLTNSDLVTFDGACSTLQGSQVVPVMLSLDKPVDHSLDIALCSEAEKMIDLALKKLLIGSLARRVNDTVTFEIKVYNQGTSTADEIIVTDYLVKGYEFIEDLNSDWRATDNVLKTKITDGLAPGENTSIFVHLKVVPDPGLEYINIAEISGVVSQECPDCLDIDSTPDEDPFNDAGGIPNAPALDNVIDGDGTVDEDDHDPARIILADIALKNELKVERAYKAGEEAEYVITIYNQGTEAVGDILVVDYIPEGLSFDPSKNLNWNILDATRVTYELDQVLEPGENLEICITLDIEDDVEDGIIINYAEVADITGVETGTKYDFDSTPDTDLNNDVGGIAFSVNDNRVDDSGLVDEDDQDPAALRISSFDLALFKTASRSSALLGDDIDFTITVVNQGTIDATNVLIYDYLPVAGSLNDADWDYLTGSTSVATFLITDVIPAGQSLDVDITLTIPANFTGNQFVNVAEIGAATDTDGNDQSTEDIDSTPNDNQNDDNGGVAGSTTDNEINDDGTIDEDDQDPARVVILSPNITNTTCLSNATNNSDGQFTDEIQIVSGEGESWTIHNVVDLYLPSSPAPPATPVLYSIGDALTATTGANGLATYSLVGLYVDGQPYELIVTNGEGDFVTVSNVGNYSPTNIDGPLALCSGTTATYTVTGASLTPPYTWTLPAEATPLGPVDETTIELEWTSTPGEYVLAFASAGCEDAISQTVAIGQMSASLACVGNVNISVAGSCEFRVTPEMVSADVLNPDAAYAVVLMDAQGNIIPNATISPDLLGQPITVKLMDGCSGNSCWSTVVFEDKTAPEVLCEDITLSCAEFLNYQGPLGADNCDNNTLVELVDESTQTFHCDPQFSSIVTRKYKATDDFGNESELCEQTISVSLLDVSTIDMPANFEISAGTNLSCRRYIEDDAGNPSPLSSGVPMVEGVALYPSDGLFCKILTTYKDDVILRDGCKTKIIRTWTVYDANCSDNLPNRFDQFIEIEDDEAPEIEDLEDITVSSNGNSCFGTALLPAAELFDHCLPTDELTVNIQYGTDFVPNANGAMVSLPMGTTEVTYTVYDDCLNSASTSFNVTVVDETSPVVVCDQNTTVAIDNTGEAVVPAAVFDDGSYDDCMLDRLEVRRLGTNNSCSTSTSFGSTVTFCCDDVGTTHRVELRAVDSNGNVNTCEVNVSVQDKYAPSITGPQNEIVECTSLLGTIDSMYLVTNFGNATAIDECGADVTSTFVVDRDNCGVNSITRTFTATDNLGSVSTTQVISVVNSSPFTEADIEWPVAEFSSQASCIGDELLPENLPDGRGYPTLTQDACDQVSVAYADLRFDFVPDADACFKILRKYTVIDWCQTNTDGSPFSWEFDQIIKVNNFTAPTIETPCTDITVDNAAGDCDDTFVDVQVTVSDVCTPDAFIVHGYYIDYGNNGTNEVEVINQNGATANASGDFPLGESRVFFFFEDMCGNEVTCTRIVTVNNVKSPTAYCRDGVVVALTGVDADGDGFFESEEACLFVHQVDGGSFHDCMIPINLSFSADSTDNKLLFDCDDVGLNEIELWVTDLNDNTSKCTLTVDVQDNNGVDACFDPKDCLIMPADTLNVTQCNADLSPTALGSIPTVIPGCGCDDFTFTFSDEALTYPNADCSAVRRTFAMTFNCTANPVTCDFVQIINVLNIEAPQVVCPDPGTITTASSTSSCTGVVSIAAAGATGICNTGIVVSNNSPFADNSGNNASGTYPVGTTTFQFIATDACGNSSSCDYSVTVTDNVNPVCTLMDITVNLDASGNAIVNFADINNGSVDSCGVIDDVVITPNSFTCTDIGDNTVNVVVSDDSGNTTNCTAVVTITENVAPTCTLMDITVTLDGMGNATITGDQLNNGSTDACGTIANFSVMPNSFDCSNVGDNTVTVTVTDDAGNTTTCTAVVTVEDEVAPVCVLQDITVSLDANNQATINGMDLNNGSTDACGSIVSFDAMPSMLDCSNVGDNTITVTVTDDSGNTTTCTATVTVTDNVAPVCTLMDITVTLDAMGTTTINGMDLNNGSTDACGSIVSFDAVPSSFDCSNVGHNTVTVTVTDDSGNTTTCTAVVTVEDNVAPICNLQDITVSIGANNEVSVDSAAIDNGSMDPCGNIVSFDIMPSVLNCSNLGNNTINVIVTDDSGNTTTCTTNVFVEDNNAPICVLQDITLSLDDTGMVNFTGDQLDNGSSSGCSGVLTFNVVPNFFGCNDIGDQTVTVTVTDQNNNSTTCTATVSVEDNMPPMLTCPGDTTLTCGADLSDLSLFGNVTASDNCDATLDTIVNVVTNVNACNVGLVQRTFILTDDNGNSSSCTQLITIDPPADPFTADDITFPADTVFLADCDPLMMMNDPGFPTIDSTAADCFNISINFVDMTAGISCQDTFERVYTVIDSCQLDGSGAGIFNFSQTIILNDTLAPILVTPGDTLIMCGDEMLPGGVFDCSTITSVTNDSPFAFDSNSANVSGNYPEGSSTTITVSATDLCGNMSSETFTITVMDTIAPDLECKKLILEIPDTQMITLFPEDFICGYTDNCTDSLDATFFFTEPFIGADSLTPPTTLFDSIPLDCTGLTAQTFEYIAGFDEAGNFFRCRIAYTLLDPNGFCTSIAEVKGNVYTETLANVANVNVDLHGAGIYATTDLDGSYAFPAMSSGGNYIVEPTKNDDPLNGVSTADIVMIQKHILGMGELNSPYKHIAADVNKSGTISTLDVLELRKLILGVQVEFENNESWRMVDAGYEFTDNLAPLAHDFDESYEIANLINDMSVDFIGVKIGDVTEDASTDLDQVNTDTKALDKKQWSVVASTDAYTSLTSYDILATEKGKLDGFQMALQIPEGQIVELKAGQLAINAAHYRIHRNVVYISYDAIGTMINDLGAALFTLVVEGTAVPASSEKMVAQVYADNITYSLDLNTQAAAIAEGLTLGQNMPNPWQSMTSIEFEIDTPQLVEIRVFDTNAKLLVNKRMVAKQGTNFFMLSDRTITSSGVLYYEVSTASGQKQIRKMIKLK